MQSLLRAEDRAAASTPQSSRTDLHGPVDVEGLRRALSAGIDAEVRFDEGTRALYATDASNYRQVPIGVVLPRTADAIEHVVAACRRFNAPVLPRGCGTSLAGQSCNVAVIIDTSKYLRSILRIDTEHRVAEVEPGVVLDELRGAANRVGLTFAPDPSTHVSNTIGGMIGNNSCGVHSLLAWPGRTSDCVEELEILTYEGERWRVGPTSEEEYTRIQAEGGRKAEVYRSLRELAETHAEAIRARYPEIPRRVSGYNLPDLLPENGFQLARALVGTEGTCVIVLRAVVRLVPNPEKRALAVLGFPDIFVAADHVPRILEFKPTGLEGIDHKLVELLEAKRLHVDEVHRLPEGRGWLLAEFGGRTEQEAREKAERLLEGLAGSAHRPSSAIVTDPAEQKAYWLVREAGLAVTAEQPDGRYAWEGWEDSAVSPERIGAYLRDLDGLYRKYRLEGQFYGHLGQGCVHTRITFDLQSDEGVAQFRSFVGEAAQTVVRHGGALSGEHGDGQSRAELLAVMYGDELVGAFREFKRIWDPRGRMNPGKVVEPAHITDHLRIRETFRPREWKTAFSYPDDRNNFNRATMRCVGIGKCRKPHGGVMCPSYMGTHEEKYTTRGRARLLYEMAQNGAIADGWRSDYVRDALDLCLSCKGCKSECPVKVDMATYKAEFLYHHYKGRIRPRAAYSLGLSYKWLPWGSTFSGVVNGLSQWRPTATLLKALGGIHRDRPMPRLARPSYRRRHRREEDYGRRAPERWAVLWPDTWNNYLHPEILSAAETVLGKLGYAVALPDRPLCCGRPLYDFGMLDRAKKLLARTLDTLSGPLDAGTPVVVLEPSCLSVFRDELPNLLPADLRSKRLAKTAISLAELAERSGRALPKLGGAAVVQPHCHEASVLGTDALRRVFESIGTDTKILGSGCCGMAGSFGMEAHKYPVSLAIAERGILPELAHRNADALVVADGFSCREQIKDLAGVYPLHTAQVLERALAH